MLLRTTVIKYLKRDSLEAILYSNHISTTYRLNEVKVKVAQSCLTLYPMDCTVHKILQARILERVAVALSRGSSQPRD